MAAEEDFAAERLQHGETTRRLLEAKEAEYEEKTQAERAELKALREEVVALRTSERNARVDAAQEQRKAVEEAVRAVEDIARKAAAERGEEPLSLRPVKPTEGEELMVRVHLRIGRSATADTEPMGSATPRATPSEQADASTAPPAGLLNSTDWDD